MGFYWIVGLDISSSFQLSRHLHRGGLNIFILSFELNNRSSCINLGSNSLMSYVHIYISSGLAADDLYICRVLSRLRNFLQL